MASRSSTLTVFAIATSGFFAIFGTFGGAVWLATIWNISLPWNIDSLYRYHPYLQLFGFVYTFIMGVSYILVPRFKNRVIAPKYAPHFTFILFISGLAVSFVSRIPGLVLLVIAKMLYFFMVARLVHRPSPYQLFFLPFSRILMVVGELQENSGFSLSLLQILLLGFPALMILGVELRTVHFRLAELRKKDAAVAFALFVAANVLSGIILILGIESLTILSSTLALLGGIIFLRSFGIFTDIAATTMSRMTDKGNKRYTYFT